MRSRKRLIGAGVYCMYSVGPLRLLADKKKDMVLVDFRILIPGRTAPIVLRLGYCKLGRRHADVQDPVHRRARRSAI